MMQKYYIFDMNLLAVFINYVTFIFILIEILKKKLTLNNKHVTCVCGLIKSLSAKIEYCEELINVVISASNIFK